MLYILLMVPKVDLTLVDADAGRGRNQNNRDGSFYASCAQSPSSKPRPLCQICNRFGHLALDCFHMLDLSFQCCQPPEKLPAMTAVKHGKTTLFTDVGATNHVTSDLGNLSLLSEYVGNDGLAVRNGKRLQIFHIGNSYHFFNGSNVSLKDILHVPSISQNLLHVSQFT